MAVFAFDFIGHEINVRGRYENVELECLRSILLREGVGHTALDIGANIGNHSLFFTGIFQEVHAFEPNPVTFRALELNVHDHPSVKTYDFGASDRDARVAAHIPDYNSGGASVNTDAGGPAHAATFALRKLDGLAELVGCGPIDFVKIDVEGHELQALQGMTGLLQQHRPLIALEQNVDQVDQQTTVVLDWLREHGYNQLYEIRSCNSAIPQSIPRLLRAPLKVLEAVARGSAPRPAHLLEVDVLEARSYPLLLAATAPLRAQE